MRRFFTPRSRNINGGLYNAANNPVEEGNTAS